MKFSFIKIIVLISIFLVSVTPTFSMEIAITIDDLPVAGELASQTTRLKITEKALAILKKHHIKNAYGFINGNKINEGNNLLILKKWIDAGQLLGNHTFSHVDLAKATSEEFIYNIEKNETILSELMKVQDYKYFRYPYLAEGNTQEKRDSVRQFLFNRHYKIAPVTVDFFEYEWNDPYIRCMNKHDNAAINLLKKTYLEQAENALIISHSLSMMLFNREIKNILLIHINNMSIDMLDELLTAYEKQQVKFISLPEALNDEVYQINPNLISERTYTFLNQVRLSRGLKNPDEVVKLHESLPEEMLNNICR